MTRCVNCGSSRLDDHGMGCALCGGSPALPWEQVYVSDETKDKLKTHSKDLKRFGITVVEYQPLEKHAGTVMTAIGLGVTVTEAIRPGTLRQVVLFLHKNLRIPRQEILQLRLDEPENISEALERQQTAKKKSATKKTTKRTKRTVVKKRAPPKKKRATRKTTNKH